MPRMRVNLRPSTIQFDDGQDPIVNGIANFGATMAKLPVQLAEIRMREAARKEDTRRYDTMQALTMKKEDREANQGAAELKLKQDQASHHEHKFEYVQPNKENAKSGFLLDQNTGEMRTAEMPQMSQKAKPQGGEFPSSDSWRNAWGLTGPLQPSGSDIPENRNFGDWMSGTPEPTQLPSMRSTNGDTMGSNDMPASYNALSGMYPPGMEHVQAPHQQPQQAQQQTSADPDVGFHAGKIAELYAASDAATDPEEKQSQFAAAQSWIGHMRAEHGEDFTQAVKAAVRALAQPTGVANAR